MSMRGGVSLDGPPRRESAVCEGEQERKQIMNGVRKSAQIVNFNRFADGWQIRESADENSSPPHLLKQPLPPPIRCTSPKLTNRNSVRPSVLQPISNVNELTLIKELGVLEHQNAALKRAYYLQGKIVDGFCKLRMEKKI